MAKHMQPLHAEGHALEGLYVLLLGHPKPGVSRNPRFCYPSHAKPSLLLLQSAKTSRGNPGSNSRSNNSGGPREGLGEPWAAFWASWGLLGVFVGPLFRAFRYYFCVFGNFIVANHIFAPILCDSGFFFSDFSLKSAIFQQFSLQNAREIHHRFRAAVVRKFRLVQCADTRFDCEKPVCERCPLDYSHC